MQRHLAPLLNLGLFVAVGGCNSGTESDAESGTQTASGATTDGASGSTLGTASSVSVSTSASASASASDSTSASTSAGTSTTAGGSESDTAATSVGTTTTGDSTTSAGTTTSGDSTTSSAITDSDSDATTSDGTTSGTTTDGTTSDGTTDGGTTGDTGDLPDFVALCDDDPANPVIVTVKPGVTARFPTITAGLAATSNGSIIEVCPGTYNDKIEVTNAITLRGAGSDLTIIDGGGFHFNLGAGAAVVEGFGFTHCNAKVPNGWNIQTSGAITMNDTYGVQETLTIRECRFFANNAQYGAGVHVSGSNNGGKNPDIIIENSVFENNTATGEGGAIASYGRVHITDSIFVDNVAQTGGALALSYGCTGPSVCSVANSVIKKNHATGSSKYQGGGGIFIDSCGLNCLGGLTVTDSDLGFGAAEENTNYQDLPEDVLINDGGDPWNRYGWYYNNVTFLCTNGSCAMP